MPPEELVLAPGPVRHDATMPPSRVSVVVADDHPLFREAIVRAVRERPDLELVGQASSGREALQRIRELTPDVAVIDLKMPDLDGLEVARAIQRDGLPTRVAILTAFLDGSLVFQAMAAGAAAYLSKDSERQAITDAIVAVARGDTVLAPEAQAGIAGEV